MSKRQRKYFKGLSKRLKFDQSNIEFHDDNIYHIITFMEPNFIIKICPLISKQWNEQARKIPVKIKLTRALKDIHFNVTDLKWSVPCFKVCEWIGKCPQMSKLTTLNIDNGIVGDEGCDTLANCPNLRNLTSLKIIGFNVGNAGCKSLINSPHLTNLRELDLSENEIDNQGLEVGKRLKYDQFDQSSFEIHETVRRGNSNITVQPKCS